MSALRLLARRASTAAQFKEALGNVAQTRITTLPNGLRVATEQTGHKTATVGLFIDSGSRAETEKNNGVAHFLEHMIFKGTAKRSQQALEEEVENIGAHLNAYTSREHTVYHAKCVSKDVPQCTEILSDILTNATLQASQVERERSVILREMQEVNSIPEEVVFDHLHSVAFQGSSLGRTILGPEENIRSITSDDLREFIKTHYTANRIVLAAAGGVEHDQLVKQAEQLFGKLPSSTAAYKAPKAPFTGADIRHRDDSIAETHIAIAVESVGWGHPDFFPLMVAQQIVGNWDQSVSSGRHLSSKLAAMCSTEHYAHRFMSFMNAYSDTGLWGAYAVTPRDHVDDFVHELLHEWGATDFEVQRAKNALRGSLLFSLDGTTPQCEELGRQVLVHGRHSSPQEVDAQIAAITADRVRSVASKYIYDKCPSVAAYGSTEAVPDYNRIRSGMFWLRV